MAKSQQPGVSAVTVWMIVFVFFWLLSTVWLVVLYTGQEELKNLNTKLQRDKRQLISPEEAGSIELVKSLSDGGPTAVGLLEEARGETARLASGDPKDGVAVVRTKRDELLRTIVNENLVQNPKNFQDAALVAGMSQLYEQFKGERSLRTAAEERAAKLEAEVARLVQLTADQKADFEKRAQSLAEQMTAVENDRSSYRGDRDAAVTAMEKEFENRRNQTDADLTKERQQRARSERQLAELRKRVASQQQKQGDVQIGPEPLITARKPDGTVLMAVPGDDIVYVDLAQGDRLTLGLRFAVYSAATGIPESGRAKAQVEVVSIGQDSSSCKIVNVAPGEVILEGDWIANPVYDRNRAPAFVVLGEFDLNRDGTPDSQGRLTIESLIREWGGTLTDDVSATTDFVVVGMAPPRPKVHADPTPEQTARAEALQRNVDRYTTTVTAANNLSIPVMPQEVFLSFLGQTVARVAQK